MPESWKTVPINAGLLVALASGMASTVFGVYIVQLWVDGRVESALDRRDAAIEQEQGRIKNKLARLETAHDWAQTRERVIIERLDRLLEAQELSVESD